MKTYSITWTDTEKSNGLHKGLRTIEVIHSYPSAIAAKWLASGTDDDDETSTVEVNKDFFAKRTFIL